MRVLLSTHSAATSASFGIVCRELWTRLRRAEPQLEVVQHGWYHDLPTEEVSWEILPTSCPDPAICSVAGASHACDRWGDQTFAEVARSVRPDVVWHLADPYMGTAVVRHRADLGYRFLYYYPVGGEPFNHFDQDGVAKLTAADPLVAATRYGSAVLESVPQLAGRRVPWIHIGVDTTALRPLPEEVRRRVRQRVGAGRVGPSTFILGWVGHDQVRKQVWVLYELLYHLRAGSWIRCRSCGRITVKEYDHRRRRLRDRRSLRTFEKGYDYRRCWYCRSRDVAAGRPRSNVVLWTVMDNTPSVGWDLRMLADVYGVWDHVYSTSPSRGDGSHTTAEMNAVYNCFDALVFPSGREGFGMPVLEAMACGVPVVYSNASAHADFASGLPVRVRFMPDSPDTATLALVDMGDLVDKVLRLMDDAALRGQLAEQGRERARRMDWDLVAARWLRLLRELG